LANRLHFFDLPKSLEKNQSSSRFPSLKTKMWNSPSKDKTVAAKRIDWMIWKFDASNGILCQSHVSLFLALRISIKKGVRSSAHRNSRTKVKHVYLL
jgi:hypothetical protein